MDKSVYNSFSKNFGRIRGTVGSSDVVFENSSNACVPPHKFESLFNKAIFHRCTVLPREAAS